MYSYIIRIMDFRKADNFILERYGSAQLVFYAVNSSSAT